MQRLFFVRHGKTEYNLANRVQGGAIDSPLLEQSKKDAVKTGAVLNSYGIKQIIASPQKRVVDTTKLITSQFHHPYAIHYAEEYKEFGYGKWEGAYIPDFEKEEPELFFNLLHRPDLYDPEAFSGETYQQLIRRGTKTVTETIKQFPDQDLLFVGHSITTTATLSSLLGKELKAIRSHTPLENTSISVLHYQNKSFSLDTWNQTGHLH
ncbi:histidine phosphatase family protein [Carnobacterium mobile]|uniref:histidine phosphatase family protein n=1 Tax=Carnobacterium mobile TaxID=2750 RepID=UPI0018693178|nr:histidine phosphatase family protein [Carnobacterium mobile]